MTLVDKVQQQIREMILNNEYDSKGHILNEGEMVERFGVSRSTVREAVRSLEISGFVKRIHGKGIKVVDNSQKVFNRTLTDMFERNQWSHIDLIEIREIIECEVCRLVVGRITAEEIAGLEQLVLAMENENQIADSYYEYDHNFHIALIKATKNEILLALCGAYMPLLHDQVRHANKCFSMEMNLPFVNEERLFHYHRSVLDAIKAKQPEDACRAMCRHIDAAKKNMLKYS